MRVICSARPNTSLAALSSLTLFAAGALVPLVPWFFTEGSAGILLSAALTAIASVFVGAWISWSSGVRSGRVPRASSRSWCSRRR
jgi:VIT1/CCC1 family predicted Fe2+/Mn2+ transporter